MDEGDVVHDPAQFRDTLTEHLAALPVRAKRPERLHPRSQAILERLDGLPEIAVLPVPLDQLGLVVEEVDVAGGARHEQLDDPLGTRPELGGAGSRARGGGVCGCSQQPIETQHSGQCDATEAASGLPKELPARSGRWGQRRPVEWRWLGHDQSTNANSLRLKRTRQRWVRPCFSVKLMKNPSSARVGGRPIAS